MRVTRTIIDQVGDITQSKSTTLIVGRIDFANECDYNKHVEAIVVDTLRSGDMARPLAEWTHFDGNVLWWTSPIIERPYVGTPHDTDWPGYPTHWTRIITPSNLGDLT